MQQGLHSSLKLVKSATCSMALARWLLRISIPILRTSSSAPAQTACRWLVMVELATWKMDTRAGSLPAKLQSTWTTHRSTREATNLNPTCKQGRRWPQREAVQLTSWEGEAMLQNCWSFEKERLLCFSSFQEVGALMFCNEDLFWNARPGLALSTDVFNLGNSSNLRIRLISYKLDRMIPYCT